MTYILLDIFSLFRENFIKITFIENVTHCLARKQNSQKATNKMALVSSYMSKIILNVNGLNSPIKKQRTAEWIKNKTHLYTAYKRFASDLRTHTSSKRRDGKRYPMEVEIKRKQEQQYLY